VDAREAPLSNVLEAIARESKAVLIGSPRTDRAVTVHLKRVRLAEALERLVGAQNFTLSLAHGAPQPCTLRLPRLWMQAPGLGYHGIGEEGGGPL
jgi:hypothetical protein